MFKKNVFQHRNMVISYLMDLILRELYDKLNKKLRFYVIKRFQPLLNIRNCLFDKLSLKRSSENHYLILNQHGFRTVI